MEDGVRVVEMAVVEVGVEGVVGVGLKLVN